MVVGVFAAGLGTRAGERNAVWIFAPDRSGGGEVFPVVGFREEGKESPGGTRLIASHQFLDSGVPDAVLEKDAEVPAGAGPPVVDCAADSAPDLPFEGDAPGAASIRSLHAEPEPRQVIRQFRGNDPAALFVRFPPVEGNPEGAATGPA